MPRVTIGLPVFNGARFVEQSIRSVLDQTYSDLELIVADNCSTDRTLEIVSRLTDDDPRVSVLHSDVNRGAAWNYNRVFAHSRGELFRWHAHDDWFEPSLIASLVDALDDHPDAILAHSWTRFVDDDGAPMRDFHDDLGVVADCPGERLTSVVRQLTYCNAVFGLIRRDVLAKTSLIKAFPGSDVSLLYELAVRGKFVVVPDLLYVRRPGSSIRSNPTKRMVAEWFDPRGTGRNLPGAMQAYSTIRAIARSDGSVRQRASTVAAFVRVWPLDYTRRLRRRAKRPAGA